MLFHVMHVHTHENCFAHKPEVLKMLGDNFKSAKEKGVNVHSMHVAPWEHTWYGVLEAESTEAIERFVDPWLELGTAKITPVTDVLGTIEKRLKGEW
jgi:Domain of unknown function (DUF3303)